jgi:hypothetical protein
MKLMPNDLQAIGIIELEQRVEAGKYFWKV